MHTSRCTFFFYFFFFNDTATTEIYTLSLHDALPICLEREMQTCGRRIDGERLNAIAEKGRKVRFKLARLGARLNRDRKSTRLNSSHTVISYAVFCLKKKKALIERISSETPEDFVWRG